MKYYLERIAVFVSILSISMSGALAYSYNTTIVYGKEKAKETVETLKQNLPPVLKRIADSESGTCGVQGSAKHYKNGKLVKNINKDKTIDIGYFQINSVHNEKAKELKLDLTKEVDNIKFAIWLFENKGTQPWSASYKCWN